MQFPLIGSCVLFSLYLVVKFIQKEYLDFLISLYFAGAAWVHSATKNASI